MTKESLKHRAADLWRYREVLPVDGPENVITLGEGFTPLVHASRLGASLGMNELYIKDEGQNPTQSFKARGMTAAVSMAKELGAQKLAVPSAGNAAGLWPHTLRAPVGGAHLHAEGYAARQRYRM